MPEEKTTAQKLDEEQKKADQEATELAREMIKERDLIVDELFSVLVEKKITYSDFMYLIIPALIEKAGNFVNTRCLQDFEITDERSKEFKRRQVEAIGR